METLIRLFFKINSHLKITQFDSLRNLNGPIKNRGTFTFVNSTGLSNRKKNSTKHLLTKIIRHDNIL